MSEARLLGVAAAASYLGISVGVVRSLFASGQLVPVRLPSCRRAGEVSRRVVFDRIDLDGLIERWKSESTSVPNAQLSAASVKGWKSSPLRKRKGAQHEPRTD